MGNSRRKPSPRYAEGAQGRRLDCTRYNRCLDVAIERDWPGFTCSGCRAYRAPDAEQQAADHLRLVRLGRLIDP